MIFKRYRQIFWEILKYSCKCDTGDTYNLESQVYFCCVQQAHERPTGFNLSEEHGLPTTSYHHICPDFITTCIQGFLDFPIVCLYFQTMIGKTCNGCPTTASRRTCLAPWLYQCYMHMRYMERYGEPTVGTIRKFPTPS